MDDFNGSLKDGKLRENEIFLPSSFRSLINPILTISLSAEGWTIAFKASRISVSPNFICGIFLIGL
jgi:hypothetical protein